MIHGVASTRTQLGLTQLSQVTGSSISKEHFTTYKVTVPYCDFKKSTFNNP